MPKFKYGIGILLNLFSILYLICSISLLTIPSNRRVCDYNTKNDFSLCFQELCFSDSYLLPVVELFERIDCESVSQAIREELKRVLKEPFLTNWRRMFESIQWDFGSVRSYNSFSLPSFFKNMWTPG